MADAVVHAYGPQKVKLNTPSLNDTDQNKHDGYNKQNVNKTAHCIGRHKPEKPRDDQN
jgi:hypothetical protein